MGISIEAFENMTPYELNLHAECFVERLNREREERLTLVWLGEYYTRIKKLPSLNDELRKMSGEKKKVMTDEEMFKKVTMINLQLGGSVLKKGGE
jgi:hypothetical protein